MVLRMRAEHRLEHAVLQPAQVKLAVEALAAGKAAARAVPKWSRTSGPQRARILYALARLVQKHSRLFAVLETMDNGKPIRESRDIDIPLVIRHFYYHAGLAQLLASEKPGLSPLGVCGAIIPWNFPLLMLAWKVAPALAAGNTVVLKPAEYTPLTALLFAEISREAGLPKGVLNIITGDGDTVLATRDVPGGHQVAGHRLVALAGPVGDAEGDGDEQQEDDCCGRADIHWSAPVPLGLYLASMAAIWRR